MKLPISFSWTIAVLVINILWLIFGTARILCLGCFHLILMFYSCTCLSIGAPFLFRSDTRFWHCAFLASLAVCCSVLILAFRAARFLQPRSPSAVALWYSRFAPRVSSSCTRCRRAWRRSAPTRCGSASRRVGCRAAATATRTPAACRRSTSTRWPRAPTRARTPSCTCSAAGQGSEVVRVDSLILNNYLTLLILFGFTLGCIAC